MQLNVTMKEARLIQDALEEYHEAECHCPVLSDEDFNTLKNLRYHLGDRLKQPNDYLHPIFQDILNTW